MSIKRRDRAVITGVGVVSPIGCGVAEFDSALRAQRHGFVPLDGDLAPGLRGYRAARLPPALRAPAGLPFAPRLDTDPVSTIAIAAAKEALDAAGLEQLPSQRVALVLGSASAGIAARSQYERGDHDWFARHRLLQESRAQRCAARVAQALGLGGPRITISTACTSSTQALGHGCDLLWSGQVDAVVAGGCDLIVEELVAGFHALGAMTSASDEPATSAGPACRPFALPPGMALGEGAAFLVLEREPDARARGVSFDWGIAGWGGSADAHHSTAPDLSGDGMARAIAAAVTDAGVCADEVDAFDAHGTGTEANDAAEWRALQRVFGAAATSLPVTATKSYFGHTLGAAGALELCALLLSLRRAALPATLGGDKPRRRAPPALVLDGSIRRPAPQLAVCHNAAFGGANAALVLARTTTSAHKPRARAQLLGWHCRHAPQIDEAELRLEGIDPRGHDRLARLLTAACAGARDHAQLSLRGAQRDRVGVFVGANRLPWDSADAFWRGGQRRGFDRAPAPAFSRIVMNAPAGAVTRALQLRGPVSVVAEGVGATLRALWLADLALSRGAADAIAVTSAFELAAGLRQDLELHSPWPSPHETAAALIIGRGSPQRRGALLGCASSGPSEPAFAVEACLERCQLASVDVVFGAADCAEHAELQSRALANLQAPVNALSGQSESLDAAALVAACAWLQTAPTCHAMVVAANALCGVTAVILAGPHSAGAA